MTANLNDSKTAGALDNLTAAQATFDAMKKTAALHIHLIGRSIAENFRADGSKIVVGLDGDIFDEAAMAASNLENVMIEYRTRAAELQVAQDAWDRAVAASRPPGRSPRPARTVRTGERARPRTAGSRNRRNPNMKTKNRITARIETRSAGPVLWVQWALDFNGEQLASGAVDSEAEAEKAISAALNDLTEAVAEACSAGVRVDRPGAVSNRPAYIGAPTAPRSGAEN